MEDLSSEIKASLGGLKVLHPSCDYFKKLAKVRLKMKSAKFKVNLTQCLVVVSCLENGVPLISVNRDYLGFKKLFGLEVL